MGGVGKGHREPPESRELKLRGEEKAADGGLKKTFSVSQVVASLSPMSGHLPAGLVTRCFPCPSPSPAASRQRLLASPGSI